MSGSLFVNNDYVSTAHNAKVPYYIDRNVALNVTGTLLIFNITIFYNKFYHKYGVQYSAII